MTAEAVRAHFRRQADSCEILGSAFTAALLRLAAERLTGDEAVGARALAWPGDPGADALGLRFTGALHGLVLSGAAPELASLYPPAPLEPEALWEGVAAVLAAHPEWLSTWLDSPPQTNETARAALLLAGLGRVADRLGLDLALYEIGASAGLNLHLDRFHHRFGAAEWGDPDAQVRLVPEIQGAPPPPPPDGLRLVDRAGCDISPVDPADPEACLRLRAYCWPDQTARRARLDAALDIAAASGLRVAQADAAEWVTRVIPNRPAGAVGVLTHSIMWQYMPEETKADITALMAREGAAAPPERPLAWVRMEDFGAPDGAVLRMTLWENGAEATEDLAVVDYHGRWLRWGG